VSKVSFRKKYSPYIFSFFYAIITSFIMKLSHITLHQFRNLKETTFSLSPHFNVFTGKNGSGKTSLLEGVHLLTTGRSFRSSHAEEFIAHSAASCILSGQLQPNDPGENLLRLGIQRDRTGGGIIRVNEKTCSTRAELAKLVPVQVLTTESYQLLHLGSKARRDFLDWALFHVEHSFHSVWVKYSRALKQRNAALKRVKIEGEEAVRAWDAELIEAGDQLDAQRKAVFKSFIPFFLEYLDEFLPNFLPSTQLRIEYKPGWMQALSMDTSLEEALNRGFSKDIHVGHTTTGPHRADLAFSLNDTPVEAQFSRGQLKLFVCALMLARSAWLLDKTGRHSLFLLDDLPSELDVEASRRLLEGLKKQGGQVWITAIEAQEWAEEGLKGEDVKMFHVEHGEIRERVWQCVGVFD
jgi:DNA replication and repair protein RecF